jgi:hypothetical protein
MASLKPRPPKVSASALRIVLFGPAGAGKTALLAALADSARTQPRLLQGHLADLSSRLTDLANLAHAGRLESTVEDGSTYPISFETFNSRLRLQAFLFDCPAEVGNNLLVQTNLLDTDARRGSTAHAILHADALICVLSGAVDDERLRQDCAELAHFLTDLRRRRGDAIRPAGLPVFIALTGTDRLARTYPRQEDWGVAVNARVAFVRDQFRSLIEDDGFGALQVQVRPTATRQPFVGGKLVQPDQANPTTTEPFGVAELFRDCLLAARAFRRHCLASQVRLYQTLLGMTTLVVLLFAGALTMLLTRETTQVVALASVVENYKAREPQTVTGRLAGSNHQRRISELREVQQSPEFEKLSPAQQQFVNERLAELEAYEAYRQRLAGVRIAPRTARTDAELAELERRLDADLALPSAYRDAWKETEVAQLRQRWRADIKALRQAMTQVEDWFNGLSRQAEELLGSGPTDTNGAVNWSAWTKRAEALVSVKSAQTPFRLDEPLPDSRPTPLDPQPLTYADVLFFRSVETTQKRWESLRARLDRLRDIGVALGLTGETSVALAPLKLPAAEVLTFNDITDRLRSIRQVYPAANEWSLRDIPPSFLPHVQPPAQSQYQTILTWAQARVLEQLQKLTDGGRESLTAWRGVADWASTSELLRDWRQLARPLLALGMENPDEPINELTTFLRRDQFKLDLTIVRLHLPETVGKVRFPDGPLKIAVKSGTGETTQLVYKLQNTERKPGQKSITIYTFVPESGAALVYRPGDEFEATLPLKDGGVMRQLSWINSRSGLYQFERLVQPPMLHDLSAAANRGERLDGATTVVTPAGGLPRVPDLLPTVPATSRAP